MAYDDDGEEYRRRTAEEARRAMIADDVDQGGEADAIAEEPPPDLTPPTPLRVVKGQGGRGDWVEVAPPAPEPPPPIPWAAEAALEDWATPFPRAWSTGFPALDKALKGGLRPESVYCLAGPTGQGKSSEAISIGLQIGRSRPVVYFSTELSRRQVLARIVGQIERVPWGEVFEWGPSEAPRLASLLRGIRLAVVKGRDLDKLVAATKQIADESGEAPLVIADYLQHLGRGRGQSDLRVGTSDAIDTISDLCCSLRCPGLVLSSMSRSSARNVKLGTDDELVGAGAESGAIEFDSSGMMVLDIDPPGDDGLRDGRIRLLKHRFGPSPITVGVRFNGRLGLFEECKLAALPPDLRAIFDAVKSGETAATEIAKMLGVRKETTVERLDLMVKRGILRRGIGQPIRICQEWSDDL